MRGSTRARLAVAGLGAAALGIVALAAGCGTRFKLPTENRANRVIPGNGTYQMIKAREALPGIQDVLLTPSGELFLLFQDPVAKTGRVEEWSPTLGDRLSTTFPGLHNPTALCFGANKIFVLDQGDTAAARTDLECIYTADCGNINFGFSRPIANLDEYWHVREYQLDGTPIGNPADSTFGGFTDTSFIWVNGIAADSRQRVYVSGVIMYCFVDPFDSHTVTLQARYRIRRYMRDVGGAGSGSVIGAWKRDPDWEVAEGTGIGFAIDPRGMQWSAVDGEALYFADRGNNEVQKLADPASYGSSFKLDIDVGAPDADTLVFHEPLDVSVDAAGSVYLLDAGNLRVLRYAADERFIQRVDIEGDAAKPPRRLTGPVAVSADTDQVYVADRALSEVLRFRRRK